MQNNSSAEGWFINDFHRKNSMAAQREVQQMSLHPCSREQKLAQIARIRRHSKIEAANKTPYLQFIHPNLFFFLGWSIYLG